MKSTRCIGIGFWKAQSIQGPKGSHECGMAYTLTPGLFLPTVSRTAGALASRSFPLVGRFCNVPNKRRSRVSFVFQAHEIMDSIAALNNLTSAPPTVEECCAFPRSSHREETRSCHWNLNSCHRGCQARQVHRARRSIDSSLIRKFPMLLALS